MFKYFIPLILFYSCSSPVVNEPEKSTATVSDSTVQLNRKRDSLAALPVVKPDDSLNALAHLMSGTWQDGQLFANLANKQAYKKYAENFSKRWLDYDTTRIKTLIDFRNNELAERFKNTTTLFYPFSGPDILYPSVFFPSAKKYILVGLEPVGTLPDINRLANDTSGNYYNQLNTALFAILKFSFFRTESMRKDLKSGELDGVLHLLFLFLNRTHNNIVSARAITLDSLGGKIYLPSFEEMNSKKRTTKGVEIVYLNPQGEQKELNYFSLDAVDYELKKNKGFLNYIQNEMSVNVYLKGASYLLHKTYFSVMRGIILNKADAVVQDDSGIAIKYFLNDSANWTYQLYGEYSKPIATFANQYQPRLDSMYKQGTSKKLAFGLGYNYRDKNSNFMIASKPTTRQ